MIDRIEFGFSFGARLPTILQTETAECGNACLAMISSFYGHKMSLPEMREKFQSSIKGTTLKDLMSFASDLNLAGRAVRLELEDLPQLQLPCILHWDMDHFVVLKKSRVSILLSMILLTVHVNLVGMNYPRTLVESL